MFATAAYFNVTSRGVSPECRKFAMISPPLSPLLTVTGIPADCDTPDSAPPFATGSTGQDLPEIMKPMNKTVRVLTMPGAMALSDLTVIICRQALMW